jgi:hypothetical protein
MFETSKDRWGSLPQVSTATKHELRVKAFLCLSSAAPRSEDRSGRDGQRCSNSTSVKRAPPFLDQ